MVEFIEKELGNIINLLESAGREIMSVYHQNDSGTFLKEDNSPVTRADLLSDYIVKEGLKGITPGIPVLSEEAKDISYSLRSEWNTLWMLDPLDGTREFLARNEEFCISLALISDRKPVAGFIYAPALQKTWFSIKGEGAFRLKGEEKIRMQAVRLDKPYRIVKSRSHYTQMEESLLQEIGTIYETEVITVGSAIKFCEIADGNADFYIKTGLINEWDIAAGHIIVEEAGGGIIDFETGMPPVYNKADSRQPPFIAFGIRGKEILKGIIQIYEKGRKY